MTTQTDLALQVLLDYSELLSKQQWNHTPEGRAFKLKFDSAVLVLDRAIERQNKPQEVKYGCHCDIAPNQKPDECVFKNGDI